MCYIFQRRLKLPIYSPFFKWVVVVCNRSFITQTSCMVYYCGLIVGTHVPVEDPWFWSIGLKFSIKTHLVWVAFIEALDPRTLRIVNMYVV